MLTITQAAKFLGKSAGTLRNMHKDGTLVPDHLTDKGHRRYSFEQLEKYRQQNTKTTTMTSHAIKVKDYDENHNKLIENFNGEDLISITCIQTEGYNGIAFMIQNANKLECRPIPFDSDALLNKTSFEFDYGLTDEDGLTRKLDA